MQKILFDTQQPVRVSARLVGKTLNLRSIEVTEPLGTEPLVITAGEQGCAVMFPYGVVVMVGLAPLEEANFLTYLAPFVNEPTDVHETEEATLKFDEHAMGKVDGDRILLSDFNLQTVQIVADILAKSVMLAYYEDKTAQSFSKVEPFATSLQRKNWGQRQSNQLLRQLGNTLSIQHKMVGRVQITDKPELLWEYPELDRLFLRLEDEYELRERHAALEQKLNLVSRTAETALELLQHNTSMRVEWYIVILIVVEILLSVYELFLK